MILSFDDFNGSPFTFGGYWVYAQYSPKAVGIHIPKVKFLVDQYQQI